MEFRLQARKRLRTKFRLVRAHLTMSISCSSYRAFLRHVRNDENTREWQFDTFIAGWNVGDLAEDLVRLWRPVRALFEDQTLYFDELRHK